MQHGFYVGADGRVQVDKPSAADELVYGLQWYNWLRGSDQYWRPRAHFRPGDTVTPPASALNGYRYRCTIGGRTASAPPAWPTSVGTVADGGVTWSFIGAEDTIASAQWSVEDGITASGADVDATGRVTRVRLSGGEAGKAYPVECRVTRAGSAEVGSQKVVVNVVGA